MRNVLDKVNEYFVRARNRAQRRKSIWDFLLILICLGIAFALWFGLFKLVWLFHVGVYPTHEFKRFWNDGVSIKGFVLSFLMVFGIMPGALSLGFILGNFFFWLVPFAKRTFEAEARGYPGTRFSEATRGLLKVCIWTLPSGLLISFLAAFYLNSLK